MRPGWAGDMFRVNALTWRVWLMAQSITRWGGLIWDWWIEAPVVMEKCEDYYPRAVRRNLGCIRAVSVRLRMIYTYLRRKRRRERPRRSRSNSVRRIDRSAR